METFKSIIDLLVSITVVLGIPAGLFQYYRTAKSDRENEEYKTYNALDEKYIEFQRLCLQYPHLDVFDTSDKTPVILNEQQKKQELIAFTLLFSIFERAYLMYLTQNKKIKKDQWSGWDEYIRQYCTRKNFVEAWNVSGTTYDVRFETYIKRIIQEKEERPNDSIEEQQKTERDLVIEGKNEKVS